MKRQLKALEGRIFVIESVVVNSENTKMDSSLRLAKDSIMDQI